LHRLPQAGLGSRNIYFNPANAIHHNGDSIDFSFATTDALVFKGQP
jgi:hypothetical protein